MHSDNQHYYYTKLWEVELLKTVESNSEGYPKKYLNNDKVVQHIYAKVGHPYTHD